jgi:4-amino-4-deoxy-L-arabinose transferase-like glycosyltransferase
MDVKSGHLKAPDFRREICTMDKKSEQPQLQPLLWVAGVALAASLVMVLVVFGRQGAVANTGDPYDYGKIAHGFVEHGFDKLTRRAAMLYPHVLAVFYWLGAGDRAVQFFQVLLHTASSSLVFIIGRHLFNTRTGLLAGLAVALHPMLLRYVPDLHTETLLVFLSVLMTWCAIRFYDSPTLKNGFFCGVVGITAAIAKGVLLPFSLVFGVVMFVRGLLKRGTPNPIAGVVVMFATMAVLLAPWTYRNYEVTNGRFVLITPGMPDAFLRGYIFTRKEFATLQKPPYTYAENESNALFRRIATESGTTWELDEVQDDVNNSKEMKRMIREHPLDTVRKIVVGMFTFWYEMTNLANSLIPGSLALISWVLAFFGLRRAHREHRPAWLLLMPILVLNAFVALLVPLGRYSVPILPLLCILAAFGVDTLLEKSEANRAAAASGSSAPAV